MFQNNFYLPILKICISTTWNAPEVESPDRKHFSQREYSAFYEILREEGPFQLCISLKQELQFDLHYSLFILISQSVPLSFSV